MKLSATTEPIFFFPGKLRAGKTGELSMDESRHLVSRRILTDQQIILINGIGEFGFAIITKQGSKREPATFAIERIYSQPRPNRAVHLATAVAKGDRQKVLLDMATQIGINDYTPLHCERSVVSASQSALLRWQRIMIEACKQSRQAWLPALHGEQSPQEAVSLAVANQQTVLFAHNRSVSTQDLDSAPKDKPIKLLIGPEGGFTEQEVDQMLAQGASGILLGEPVLRIETAAIVGLGLVKDC